MKIQKKRPGRVKSYDFFRGIVGVGLIFFLTLAYLFPHHSNIEFFYRWAHLGFLFFFGIIAGESTRGEKISKKLFNFFRRGIQVLGIFLGINILFQLPAGITLIDFSIAVIRGDYDLFAPLLLPLGIFFMMIPFLSFLPAFLGFSWSVVLFFLLDIIAFEEKFISFNAFFLVFTCFGFYTGRLFSLDSIREKWNAKFSILPFLFLYIALGILFIGDILGTKIFSILSIFWFFHGLVLLLFYFSLPNTLFLQIPNIPKSALQKFFAPLGADLLFLYISLSVGLEIVTRILPSFFLKNLVETYIFAVHLTILFFAIILLLQKAGKKNKKFQKIFRFLF